MAGNLVPSEGPESLQSAASGMAPAAYEPGYPDSEDDDGGVINWSRYLAAVKRYKWLILLVTILGTAAGVLATRFMQPVYTVKSTVWIELPPRDNGPLRADGIVKGQNWVELLTTFRVLDSVVRKERLYLHVSGKDAAAFRAFQAGHRFVPGSFKLKVDDAGRTFVLSNNAGTAIQRGTVGDSIGPKLGWQWAPPRAILGPGRTLSFTLLSPRDASETLKLQLTSLLAQDGNFLRLALKGPDPQRLTNILNTLTAQYVSVAAELKKQQTTQMAANLKVQMDSTGRALQEADSKLEGFKIRTITKPSEATAVSPGIGLTQNTVMNDYFGNRQQAIQIDQDLISLQRVLQRSRSGALVVDELMTIGAVQKAPDLQRALTELSTSEQELRALQVRYGDDYPSVKLAQDKVNTLRSTTIPAHIQALITGLRAQQTQLQSYLATASQELQAIPSRTITEQALERNRATLAALFAQVQSRYQEARLAEAAAIPDVKLLDPAVPPERPASNSAPMVIAGAFFASMALALALAILLDRLDKRFRYPDQVTRDLGLSILGAVPAIRKVDPSHRDPEESAQVVEAFRTIRMNLAHSYGAAGPVMLTVSSPAPGDGKSLVASNLALSFAEAGYRTLLIDGDVRRGELHRLFATERRPGLLDLLLGSTTLEQVLRPASHRNLTVIPCGTRHHHAPELLGSAAMRELLAEMKTRYSAIIVDSPPLGAGIDPFVLGTATGNIMLVFRSGETDRQMAEAKVRLLDRLPIRILGAVLNDISTAESAYKYYRYVYGYTADEEPAAQLAVGPAEVGEHS